MKLESIFKRSKYLLSVFFVAAGSNHFVNESFYLSIMPPYIPWHLFLVYLSGALEVVLGALILLPRFRIIGSWGLILLLVAVFPANIHMALNTDAFPQFSAWALWARLPFQAILIAWVYKSTQS